MLSINSPLTSRFGYHHQRGGFASHIAVNFTERDFSGPKRYDYVPETDQWIYLREQRPLGELLNTELSKIFSQDVDLRINKVSDCM